jgi:hypothetical protein
MYTDEYLPDDAVFEDETNISIDETSSMDTNERDRKKRHELYKRSDPDYYSFKLKKQNEDGDLYYHKVELYSTPSAGFIRNASSGVREPYKAGSKFEDLYFRVKDVALNTGTQSRKLFYKNPEEFERHQFVKVSQHAKKEWSEKYMNAVAVLHE